MLTDVLVPLFTYPDETSSAALAGIARLLDGFATRVTYCGVEIDVPDLADRWGAQLAALPQMAQDIERRSREGAGRLLTEAMALPSGYVAEALQLRAAFLDPGVTVSAQARHHDVSVLSTRPGSEGGKAIAEHLLFGSGRPLLLVPEVAAPGTIERIAIAWDGSPTASRAVYDGMPLITRARAVTVLTASRDKSIAAPSIAALVRYLERHGVQADVTDVSPGAGGIGQDLQAAALSSQASLLVMGGYGHSRLREFILGGATSSVLNATTLPVFMSR